MASPSTPPKKKVKGWYTQSFREEWLKDPELKDWLREDHVEKGVCYCICCDVKLRNANKSMLLTHRGTAKHQKSAKCAKGSTKIADFFSKSVPTMKEEVAKAELTIAACIAEANVPYAQCDRIVKGFKKAFHDSEIGKKVSLKKTKLSYIIQDGIAYYERDEISKVCRNQKFSLLIDESTDISVTQILAVVIRFFYAKKLDVVDVLLDTVKVENGSAQGLYQAITALLQEKSIPMRNIVGFGSDNCSTMMGTKSGFQALLRKDVPDIFVMGCVCHSFALCSSHAVKVLPPYLETLLKNVSSYFSRSSKRVNYFNSIQDVVKVAHHKIPKLAQTRWLSRGNVIKVILEQWDALLLYFQTESKVDQVDGANWIYKTLLYRGTKHMLVFLEYVLQKVNALNTEFQSEHFRLHLLHKMVSLEYSNILSCFIKQEVMASFKLSEIDIRNEKFYKKLEDLYLGGRAMALLSKEPLGDQGEKNFKTDCLKFLVELAKQIKQRFPLDEDGVIANLNILDPVLAQDPAKSPTSLVKLAVNFPSFVPENELNELDDEWRSFRVSKEIAPDYDTIPEFWYKLRNIKDGLDNPKFEKLSLFMTNLTILPHSSASVERVFSQVNLVKTRNTNSLKPDSVRDKLLARQAVTRGGHNSDTWEPNSELIKDVMEGSCHRRYQKRLKDLQESNKVTLQEVSEFETDPDPEVQL